MKILKKIFLVSFILILHSSNCYSKESLKLQVGNDYLLTTNKTVAKAIVTNSNILVINPFFTIFNKKNILLIHPKKIGETQITIFANNKKNIFSVKVVADKFTLNNNIIKNDNFELMLLDKPPAMKKIEDK